MRRSLLIGSAIGVLVLGQFVAAGTTVTETAHAPAGAFASAAVLQAQDPVKVDPRHYRVEFENEQVRVLRVVYGPGEKSPMHEHRPYTAIFLTDGGPFRFTLPDGTVQPGDAVKRGAVNHAPAEAHEVEHLGKSTRYRARRYS